MNPVTVEQLDALGREELLALLKVLLPEFEALRLRVAQLEAENAELKQRLDKSTNSSNSSQPPSRDQKMNQAQPPRRKPGPPHGHEPHQRVFVDSPTQVVQVPVKECESCLADLSNLVPEDFTRRQITEIPEIKPFVIETRQHHVTCPHCQQLNRAPLPPGLEAARVFGPHLEALVVWYKQTQLMSYERIVATMADVYGVKLSEGAVDAILRRAGEKAAPLAETIKEQVLQPDAVVRSDETSARVGARNWWQWVFRSQPGQYHTIVPTRSAAAITTVLDDREVYAWVSDCYGPQLQAPAAFFQLCLAHQLRDLQRILDTHPRVTWARRGQQLFRQAIHLRNRYLKGELTPDGFQRRVTQLENQLDDYLQKKLSNTAAQKLLNRFTRHRDKLLTFLYDPAIPPTNNEAEQALRGAVIHRKVTNGFRSARGARTYAALQTVIATARQKGEDAFRTLVHLMGTPLFSYLEGATP
jgi:transposase